MKLTFLTTFVALLLAGCSLAFAKEDGMTVTVAGFVYSYDEVVAADTDGNGTNDRNSYYKGGKLVLSAYDENGDGKDDLWFEWKDDKVVLEMRASGGGAPDEFIVVDDNEQALPIETPEGGGSFSGSWKWLVIIGAVAGIWWYKKKRISTFTTHASR